MISWMLFICYAAVLFWVSSNQSRDSATMLVALEQFREDVIAHRKAVEDYTMRVEVLRDLLNRMEDQRAKGR